MENKIESSAGIDYDITTTVPTKHDITPQYDITTPVAQSSSSSRAQPPSFSSLLTTVKGLLASMTTINYFVTPNPTAPSGDGLSYNQSDSSVAHNDSVVGMNITFAEIYHIFHPLNSSSASQITCNNIYNNNSGGDTNNIPSASHTLNVD